MHFLFVTLSILILLFVLLFVGIWLDIASGKRVKGPLLTKHTMDRSYNKLHYYTEGHDLFREMRQTIDAAKDHVYLSFFIFEADEAGKPWLELLMQKARQGLDVRLLVDFLNSRSLHRNLDELRAAGVHVAFSGKIKFPFTFYYLNRRNHRKILTVDGTTGYFGGFNVGMEYLGNNSLMGEWHDNHLRLEGNGVLHLEHVFAADWLAATGETLDFSKQVAVGDGPSTLDLIATNANQAEDIFADYFRKARSSIVICSPYFIPSKKLFDVLLDRLANGIELSILVPMKADHMLVKPASFYYLAPLVEKGAHLYRFHQGFYHAKIFIVDKRRFYIGSANFDQRSLFWNDELLSFSEDPALAAELLAQFERDVTDCSKEFTKEDFSRRSLVDHVKTACTLPFHSFL